MMFAIFRSPGCQRGVWRCLLLLMGCVLATAPFGCGRQGPERVVVSGTVTYRGQPLKEGCIRLVPAKGTVAPVSVAAIIDGRYVIKSHGGVPVGTHRIEITAYKANKQQQAAASATQSDMPGVETPSKVSQFIPEKYNTKSELQITVPSGSGAITKNFDLTD
jgi:hypothetical protein